MRPPSLLGLLCVLAAAASGPLWGATIIVSPNGNDAADGSEASPFATLQRARDAARDALKRGESVEILIQGGNYELKEPIALGPQDSGTEKSPVLWRAVDGAEVRISAGRQITGWQKVSDPAVRAELYESVRDRVLEIDLKKCGVTDYGEMKGGFSLPTSTGLELFAEDAPMTVSRYPNDGFITITQLSGTTEVDVRGIKGMKEPIFQVADKQVARWTKEKDPRVLGYWFWDWADNRGKIESIDPATLTITLQDKQGFGYRKDQYFYGYNLLSEIDRPGEWYLDRETGMLYLLPPEKRTPERSMVSLLPTVLKLEKVAHVKFSGITFEGARDETVIMKDCESVILNGCIIRNGGKSGVFVQGGQHCEVRNCDIYGMGGGGVFLGGGDRATLTPAKHLVENCHIHHYSRWSRTYNPALRLEGVGNRIAHNLIHHAPHQAIDFTGNDHLIEFNEIHNVCAETNDAGAVYAWNDWAGRGNVFRNNYLHHVYGNKGKGAFGIYLDDNFSSAVIEGNIFEVMLKPVFIGGGRDFVVSGNIFVDCLQAFHVDARGITWREGGGEDLKKKLEQWPYKSPPWSERYPELLTLLEDQPLTPKNILIAQNILVNSTWDDIDREADPYVTLKHNLFDASDVLTNQYGKIPRVNLEALPVRAIKFPPVPYEKIGLYQTSERKVWPVKHPVERQDWKL